jgi:hypothetical protein
VVTAPPMVADMKNFMFSDDRPSLVEERPKRISTKVRTAIEAIVNGFPECRGLRSAPTNRRTSPPKVE